MQDKTPRNEKDQRHGHWEIYHANGNIYHRAIYINNEPYGLWEWHQLKVKLIFRRYYAK